MHILHKHAISKCCMQITRWTAAQYVSTVATFFWSVLVIMFVGVISRWLAVDCLISHDAGHLASCEICSTYDTALVNI